MSPYTKQRKFVARQWQNHLWFIPTTNAWLQYISDQNSCHYKAHWSLLQEEFFPIWWNCVSWIYGFFSMPLCKIQNISWTEGNTLHSVMRFVWSRCQSRGPNPTTWNSISSHHSHPSFNIPAPHHSIAISGINHCLHLLEGRTEMFCRRSNGELQVVERRGRHWHTLCRLHKNCESKLEDWEEMLYCMVMVTVDGHRLSLLLMEWQMWLKREDSFYQPRTYFTIIWSRLYLRLQD